MSGEDDYAGGGPDAVSEKMTDPDDLFDDHDRERTPISQTPIVLNPKVDGPETILECPHCGEEIQCVAKKPEPPIVVEYECGCDELRRFKIKGDEEAKELVQ